MKWITLALATVVAALATGVASAAPPSADQACGVARISVATNLYDTPYPIYGDGTFVFNHVTSNVIWFGSGDIRRINGTDYMFGVSHHFRFLGGPLDGLQIAGTGSFAEPLGVPWLMTPYRETIPLTAGATGELRVIGNSQLVYGGPTTATLIGKICLP
jgi:hypothetical protein